MIGKPGRTLWIAVAVLALISAAAEFFIHKHGYFPVEDLPLSFAAFGLIGLAAFVLVAVAVRAVVGAGQDFYGSGNVDTEDGRGAGTEAEMAHGD